MGYRGLFSAASAAALIALGGCGGGTASALDLPDAYAPAFEAQVTSSANSTDFAEMQADFAEFGLFLTAGSVGEGDNGALRLSDVMVSGEEGSPVGVRAGQLDIWGADFGLLAAHIAGEDTGAGGTVVARLDARDVEVVGLETLYQPLMDGMMAQIEEMQADLPDNGMPDQDVAISGYEVSADRLMLAGFKLHPRETPTPHAEGDEDFAVLQAVAVEMRAVSLDALVMEDMVAAMEATQYGAPFNNRYESEFVGVRGLSRGDLAGYDLTDTTITMDMAFPVPDPSGEFGASTLPVDGTIGVQRIEDMRFSGVLEAIIDAKIPEIDQTDLISFGHWIMEDFNYTIEGRTFMAMDAFEADFSDSHWLLPERITIDMDQLVYDYGAMAPLFSELMATAEPEMAGVVEDVVAVLDTYGILNAPSDFDLDYTWSPERGGITLAMEQVTEGFGAMSASAAGAIPAFNDWAPNIPLDGSEPTEEISARMEKLFTRQSIYDGMRLELRDTGGLDKYFNAAVDIAAVLPVEDNPQLEAFAQYDAATLRQMLSGIVLMGGGQANKELPGAATWFSAMAGFIREGGTLTFSATPDAPLSAASIRAIDEAHNGDPPPALIIETLGLSVIHTPDD